MLATKTKGLNCFPVLAERVNSVKKVMPGAAPSI